MIKVLLVDDEILVRNRIRSLMDWEACGYYICGEASNGKSAMDLLESLKPQIVILDIHMPVTNGLQLIEYIAQQANGTQMIVLSSYDKYEYVRTSLTNGVVDYLLKHRMEAKELLEVLNKAKMEISNHMKTKDGQFITEQWEQFGSTVTRNYVRQLVLGNCPDLDMVKKYMETVVRFNFINTYVIVFQVFNFMIITHRFNEEEKNKYMHTIIDLCQQVMSQFVEGLTANIDQGKFVILCSFSSVRSKQRIQNTLYQIMTKIEETLQNYFNITATFGCSEGCSRITEIHNGYLTANDRLLRPRKSSSMTTKHQPVRMLTIKQEKDLLDAVNQFDKNQLNMILSDILAGFEGNDAQWHDIQTIVSELIQLADKIWRKSGAEGNYFDNHQVANMSVWSQMEEVSAVFQEIRALFEHLIEQLVRIQNKEAQYSEHVQSAIRYIHEHYNHEVSLANMAEFAGISPSYLSHLFKEEVGIHFTEYLNRLRIDKLILYLEDGHHKIKEVYDKVGFSSYNYFFKVFKNTVGMTPSAYFRRKQEFS